MKEVHKRDLRTLPKAELHLHLNGSMRPATLTELCKLRSIERPEATAGKMFDDFSQFNSVYIAACECIQEEEDLARLITEVAQDAASEGVRWIEPALSGHYYKTFGGVRNTLDIVMRTIEKATRITGVGIGVIVAADRSKPVEEAMELARDTIEYMKKNKHNIVGFGLHSNERNNPPDPFKEVFEFINAHGLLALPHGGEIPPNPKKPVISGVNSVKNCVELLGAARIAHGVAAASDEELIELLKSHKCTLTGKKVCLDMAPTSNYLLKVVKDLSNHPIKQLMGNGVAVTINSDDSLLFGPRILHEYELCRDLIGLSDEDLAQIARNSFIYSSAPEDIQKKALYDIELWLQ